MEIAIVVMFLALACALAGAYHSRDARMRGVIAAMPRRSIATLAAGEACRVVGRVAPGETLRAPITGRACVFYEVVVEEHRGGHGHHRRHHHGHHGHWHELAREVYGVAFVVDDGTGRAVVDPRGCQFAVERDATTRSGFLDDATPAEDAFLARNGLRATGALFNRTLRYREGVLEVGEYVAVAGRATPLAGAPGTPTVGFTTAPDLPLRLSDHAGTMR